MTLRHRTARVLHYPDSRSKAGRWINLSLAVFILLSVLALVIDTVPDLPPGWHEGLRILEKVFFAVFLVEYLARLWSIVEVPRFDSPVGGRLRFSMRLLPLIDLAVLLSYFAPFDLRFLRMLRVVRLLGVLHLKRYEKPLRAIGASIRSRKRLLVISVAAMLLMIFFAASGMYFIERDAQPKAFSSIPASLWWAVMTLTTVGYGDIYPVTVLGKIFAGVIATCGIAVFALPMAIVTAAILDVDVKLLADDDLEASLSSEKREQ
jgi:voltage-gated potassium channel